VLLYSEVPDNQADETVMEKYNAKALYSVGKRCMYVIGAEDNEAPQYRTSHLIQIAKHWTNRWWSESTLQIAKLVFWIPKINAHGADHKWTEPEEANLMNKWERYTVQSPSGVWTVHRCELFGFEWYISIM
jgi:hypothetical protein